MPTYVLLAAVAIGASLPLLFWSLAGARSSSLLVRRNLGAAFSRPLATVRRPKFSPRLLPASYVHELEQRIDRTGRTGSASIDTAFWP